MRQISLPLKQFTYLVLLLAAWAVAVPAQAETLTVQFERTPLFSETNVAPGQSVARTVVVSNHGSSTEAVYVTTRTETDNGLAALMQLQIASSSELYFNDSFATLFASDPIELGTLPPQATRTYRFMARLLAGADDSYQGTSMSFDLVVGFEGGAAVSDGGSASGGGSSSGSASGGILSVPDGRVAGAATDALHDAWSDVAVPVIGKVRGVLTAIAGETAEAEATTSAAAGSSTLTNNAIARKEDESAAAHQAEHCLMWILLFLIGSFLLWGFLNAYGMYREAPWQQRFVRKWPWYFGSVGIIGLGLTWWGVFCIFWPFLLLLGLVAVLIWWRN